MRFKTVILSVIVLSLACLLILSFSGSFDVNSPHNVDKDQKTILTNVRRILTLRHFEPKTLNDQFSENVFDYYLEQIDPSKRFLIQSDYDQMIKSRHKMDDYLKKVNLSFYHSSIDKISTRIKYISDHLQSLIDKSFDFNKQDSLNLDEKKYNYAKSEKELLEKWHKILKYRILTEITSIQQKEKKESKNSNYKEKSFITIKKEAVKEVKNEFKTFFKRLLGRYKKDGFTLYVNSYTQTFDPHTNYFSPKDKEDFDFNISGKLEGIGAVIKDVKGTAIIDRILIGSPCWKQGDLEVGDKILKVAQQAEEPVSIIGMSLDDAIHLIRGKKGTTVILSVEKEDGSKKDIPIVRDIVENDAVYAKSAVITDKNNDRYGLINLPEFYFDPNNPRGRNAADDFEKELLALKSDNVEGIVIDLRNNGGGSLDTAIKIAGMFIDKGPVVQVETQAKNVRILKDNNEKIDWNGPVVILVNELSASASEILAAALQDYGRAVIIGGKQTFGKGTVQTFYPVNFLGVSKDLGAVKLTIQKFYRINGGSTQLKGVTPDITLPSKLSYSDIGEKEYEYPLNYDKIAPIKYKKWKGSTDLEKIKEKSKKRIYNDSIFNYTKKAANWFNQLKNHKTVNLNFSQHNKNEKQRKRKAKYFDSIFDHYKNHLKILSPSYEKTLIKTDSVLAEKRKKWHKVQEKDIELKEAINVLSDMNKTTAMKH